MLHILYVCRSTSASPQNVVQLSVHLATTLLDVTVKFLERALEAGLTPPTLQLLGSSFMFSTLLPTTLAQLGPVACRQPRVYIVYQLLVIPLNFCYFHSVILLHFSLSLSHACTHPFLLSLPPITPLHCVVCSGSA